MEMTYVRKRIEEASNLVCLLGISTSMDCGCLNYRQEDGLYDLEQKYGHAPEEIFSSVFFSTRPQQFFDFYKTEILKRTGMPDDCMKTLARMETDGRLKAIITRELFSLPRRAGCQNVVELHGSIYENHCPRCGKAFDIGYMLETDGVPLCPECKVPIRPGVNLIGDRMSSARITMAAAELAKADTLLILGGHMETPLVSNMLPYFHGNLVILVNESKHLSDRMADFTYYGKPRDILPQLYPAAADAISA